MAKQKTGQRIDPSSTQRTKLLARNHGVCCVCKQRYLGVHIHHIDGDASNTVDANLAVVCVQDHDVHHRPAAYEGSGHPELSPSEIRAKKESWETFVAAASGTTPTVLATVTGYGNTTHIHSMKMVMHWPDGRIEYERIYHLHSGPMESWAAGRMRF